jgi:membrane-associated protease RseP (regulator of RpoE activity)
MAVLLCVAAAWTLEAQGSAPLPVRTRDSVFVRMMDPSLRARIDSIMALNRLLQDAPLLSPASVKLHQEIESMTVEMMTKDRSRFGDSGGTQKMFFRKTDMLGQGGLRCWKGWIGINTAPVPRDQLMKGDSCYERYYVYPPIISVEPDSPAQRAGIVRGDVLVAYGGVDVLSRPLNITQMLEPDTKLVVTVRRDGEDRDFNLMVARAPERIEARRSAFGDMPPFPFGIQVERTLKTLGDEPGGTGALAGAIMMGARGFDPASAPSLVRPLIVYAGGVTGVFGATLMTLKPELAKTLKLETGVLVTEVADDAPGYRAGLRTGDVITAVEGQNVATAGEIARLVAAHGGDHSVSLQILRDRKVRKITVNWPSAP